MSSPNRFLTSSQISPGKGRIGRSKFTYKHLSLLSQSSISCPLRVTAHIDLDAFYAQCEGLRLGIAEDQPLAVQQWTGLIAINYPARKYGIGRFADISEAKKLCPNLILQHVATWREGDEKWQYHEDASKHVGTHKVSLDPYRLQSRKIFACVRDVLPPPPQQRVEKASIDEFFLDLSAQVHSIMLARYPVLQGPPPYDDPTEKLPRPPTTALDWDTDALVDLDESETEDDDPDWDDIAMLIGSEIVREVRAAIWERLRYTCSAGIARNKMIAKLGSAHQKPNQQTIVRARAIQQFLSTFKIAKIRNLGGKLGDEVAATFGTEQVTGLLPISLEHMKLKLGDDTGSWVYHIIRGQDSSDVSPRTQIKSMLSAKSFRPTINSFGQAHRWLRIFVADIFSRLVEEGVLENKRRPKTMNLLHRQGTQTRSRQAPIPMGSSIDEALLFHIAKNILAQIIVDGRAWPCSNLSLSVGGFEEGPSGNKGIGGFLLRGDEAKAMSNSSLNGSRHGLLAERHQPAKRCRTENGASPSLFARQNTSHGELPGDATDIRESSINRLEELEVSNKGARTSNGVDGRCPEQGSLDTHIERRDGEATVLETETQQPLHQRALTSYFCGRCKASIPTAGKEKHEDWHFARELQKQEQSAAPSLPLSTNSSKKRGRPPVHASVPKNVGKGQSRLAFGK